MCNLVISSSNSEFTLFGQFYYAEMLCVLFFVCLFYKPCFNVFLFFFFLLSYFLQFFPPMNTGIIEYHSPQNYWQLLLLIPMCNLLIILDYVLMGSFQVPNQMNINSKIWILGGSFFFLWFFETCECHLAGHKGFADMIVILKWGQYYGLWSCKCSSIRWRFKEFYRQSDRRR